MAIFDAEPNRKASTPVKAVGALATPTGTGHATRTRKRTLASSSPARPELADAPPPPAMPARLATKRGRNPSSFGAWKRTKTGMEPSADTVKSTKRDAGTLEAPAEGHKRLRGSRA
jgi:hypothetical protein